MDPVKSDGSKPNSIPLHLEKIGKVISSSFRFVANVLCLPVHLLDVLFRETLAKVYRPWKGVALTHLKNRCSYMAQNVENIRKITGIGKKILGPVEQEEEGVGEEDPLGTKGSSRPEKPLIDSESPASEPKPQPLVKPQENIPISTELPPALPPKEETPSETLPPQPKKIKKPKGLPPAIEEAQAKEDGPLRDQYRRKITDCVTNEGGDEEVLALVEKFLAMGTLPITKIGGLQAEDALEDIQDKLKEQTLLTPSDSRLLNTFLDGTYGFSKEKLQTLKDISR